eukprot:scaffold328775_cov49-Attheya_sp.AAC.1
MDVVVRPGGCCRQDDNNGEPNCPIQIGSLRESCLSAAGAFTLWANNINGCDDGAIVTEISPEGAICMAGSHCRNGAVTKLCMWPNAGHQWAQMPGEAMIGDFIAELFSSDISSSLSPTKGSGAVPADMHNESGLQASDHRFSLIIIVTIILAFTALVGLHLLRQRSLFSRTRKSSISDMRTDEEEEIIELVSSREF